MLCLMLGLGADTDTCCLKQQVPMDGPAVLHQSGCTGDISLQNFYPQRKGHGQNENVLFVQDTSWKFACSLHSVHFVQWAEFLNNCVPHHKIQGVPLPTKPGISLIILPLMRMLQRGFRRTTDTFLFISHTKNILLFKFCCNIFNAGFGSEWDTLYMSPKLLN